MAEILQISLIAFMFCAISQKEGSILNWYYKIIKRFPDWISNPLGGCHMCFTGQVCLWYFMFTKPFDLTELGFFISAGILSSMVYNKIYCYLK